MCGQAVWRGKEQGAEAIQGALAALCQPVSALLGLAGRGLAWSPVRKSRSNERGRKAYIVPYSPTQLLVRAFTRGAQNNDGANDSSHVCGSQRAPCLSTNFYF